MAERVLSLFISDDVPGTADGPIVFTFTFSEDVTNFDSSDIELLNGNRGVFSTINSSVYSLVAIPNSTSPVAVSVSSSTNIETIAVSTITNQPIRLLSDVARVQVVNSGVTDVLRVQGDYKIITAPAGTITLDTSIDAGSGVTTGTVIITGDLLVRGATQFGVSTTVVEDTNVTDRVVTLNFGETGGAIQNRGNITGDGYSGIKIARGNVAIPNRNDYAAFIEWNDNATWQGTGAVSNVEGLFEFRVGKTNPSYSAIKINAIRIDPASAPTAGAGAGQGPRLNIFGSDNPTAVISVAGTNNYAARVTDPDDIPNKAYVDQVLIGGPDTVENLVVGKSYVKIIDSFTNAVPSAIIGVLNGDPSESKTSAVLTGTTVMRITESVAQFSGIQFVDNEILPTRQDTNLRLAADGTGQIVLAAPLLFENDTVPRPSQGQTGIYVGDPGGGGTGVYFVSSSTLGVITSDEFVSRKKALIYSLIF
jgi:hypothetical protein